MNAIEFKRKDNKINEADRFPAAHNGLLAGSSPTGPAKLRLADRARTAGVVVAIEHQVARKPVFPCKPGLVELSVSVRRVLESYESSVIQEWWPDSRRGHRCGRARTAPATTAAICDIPAI